MAAGRAPEVSRPGDIMAVTVRRPLELADPDRWSSCSAGCGGWFVEPGWDNSAGAVCPRWMGTSARLSYCALNAWRSRTGIAWRWTMDSGGQTSTAIGRS